MIDNSRRFVAGCFMLALLALCAHARAQMPPAAVVVDEARLETIEQYREVVGELRALRRALLAAEDEGLVVELSLEEGDAVKPGAVVARLRDTRTEMELHRAEAEVAARRAEIAERTADLERARRDVARVDELQLRGSAVQAEIEDRRSIVSANEARLASAKAALEAAEATLGIARDRLERRSVTAPFAGFVISKRTEVGQWVRQGDPVLEIIALEQIEARLNVPESMVNHLQNSAEPVRIRIHATGEVVFAPVLAIIPDADPLSRLVPVRLRLENPGRRLRPGMSIAGLVPSGTREPSLTIHKDGIRRDDAGEFVFFNAGGVAAVARVQSIFPVGERVAVRSSVLRPQMAVVVEGNERLQPGTPLNILQNRSAGPSAGGAAPAGAGQPAAGGEGQGR